MMADAGSSMKKGVRIFCALALLFVGFAHKVPMLNEASIQPVEISQYVFPDGTRHVLCLTDEARGGEHDHWDLGSPCEACRLSVSSLSPMPQDTTWLISFPADCYAEEYPETYRRPHLLPNAAPRGPPPVATRTAVALSTAIFASAG